MKITYYNIHIHVTCIHYDLFSKKNQHVAFLVKSNLQVGENKLRVGKIIITVIEKNV